MEQKYCKYCKTLKDIEQFTKGKAVCKVCRNAEATKNTKAKGAKMCLHCEKSKIKNDFAKYDNVCNDCGIELQKNIYKEARLQKYNI